MITRREQSSELTTYRTIEIRSKTIKSRQQFQ